MSAKQSRGKTWTEVVTELGNTTDPAVAARLLKVAHDRGLHQRAVSRGAGAAIAGRRFDESTGRYVQVQDEPESHAVPAAPTLQTFAVLCLAELVGQPAYQTVTDKRLAAYRYPDVLTVAEQELRASLNRPQSLVQRAQILRHSVACTQGILHVSSLPPWRPVDAPPINAVRQAAEAFKVPVRATQQPHFPELPPPRWHHVVKTAGEHTVALACRSEVLLSAQHPPETLIHSTREYGSPRENKVTAQRSFCVTREQWWAADPALEFFSNGTDEETGTSLASQSITELTSLAKGCADGMEDMVLPMANIVVVRHALQLEPAA
jgi:hypothetical protein